MRPRVLLLLAALIAAAPVLAEDDTEDLDRAAAEAAYLQGEDHLEAGRLTEAADALWKAIEADRTFLPAHVRYQEAVQRQGDAPADLRADYESFRTDYPKDLAFVLHCLRLDDAEKRVKALESLRRRHKPQADLIDGEIGYAYLQLGEPASAIRILKGPAKRGDLRAVVLLVRAQASAGKAKHALQTAKPYGQNPAVLMEAARATLLGGQWKEALAIAEGLRETRKGSTRRVLMHAEALERLGQHKPAIDVLVAGRRATVDAVPVLLALAGLVQRSEDAQDLDRAAEIYDGVIKNDAEHTRAIYGLAWVREQQEKFEEAEKLYRKVASLLPDDPSPIESVGYVFYLQDKMGEAEAQFRRAIDLDPKYASAYANLGATFDARAEYSKAISWYEKLLRLPGEENNIRALVNCAFDNEQLGNFKKAEKYLRRALKQRPKDADLHVWLGDNYYFQEKWRDAAKSYLTAIELDDTSFFAWRGLGMTFGHTKKWNDAVDALEKARALDGEDAEVRLALGGIYYQQLRDKEKALELFEEYVALGGDDPDIPPLIEAIKEELEK